MRPFTAIIEGMAFSSAPNDSEDGRAFLQQRLALFGKSVFFLFLAIGVVGAIVSYATLRHTWSRHHPPPVHLVLIYGVGLVWLFCRRGTRSLRTLAALDGSSVVIVGIGLALALEIAPPQALAEVPCTFALTHLLLARAIIVPSDWRRTLCISALAAVGLVVGILVLKGTRTVEGLGPVLTAMLTVWSVVAVVVASWTSHVIYRLRRRVVEARRLGQYTLEDKIGEGGMGVVFRARHSMLRRPTVVKLLPLERAGQANLARFEREVQLSSQLSSPNTVAIYDFGRTPDGIFYYAMEYLDGVDLEELVDRKSVV